MAGLTFYYLGDDEAYLKTLQGAFKNFASDPIKWVRIFETDESKIQSIFVRVYREKPNAVFIDLSQETENYLHLSRLLSRTPTEGKILSIGLVDLLSPRTVLNESIATGADLSFVKGSEAFDVVFSVLSLMWPGEKREHEFASAPLKETWEAGVPCKVGYVDHTGIHIETDFPLSSGQKIRFHHNWSDKEIVPSLQMKVKNVSNKNLFYQFGTNADLDFAFVDEYVPEEGTDEGTIFERREDRSRKIETVKNKLLDWLDRNRTKSQEKKARVLIVDEKFAFYQDQKRTDKHPYTIRCIADFSSLQDQLNRIDPQVIAISVTKENLNNLSVLASNLKKTHPEKLPFLVFFNVIENSKDFQTRLDYPALMATQNEISVDVLVKMAAIFEKKMTEAQVIKTSDPVKVFIKKNNEASFGEILIDLQITKISESDLFFKSDLDLEQGTNLHFKFPVDMHISTLLVKKDPKGNEYHGLIHSLGETEKKELRKYVNSVFFRDHDAQLQAQSDEFKLLNETKLQEKVAEIEKAEKEKLEKEEEEKKNAS